LSQCGDVRDVRPDSGEIADAGSIDKCGIELAVILAVGLDLIMRPTGYDSLHSRR
jgi:hypothetical protein